MSRAPITLSREMKLGLIALLMLGLLGGWLVYNNNRAADQTLTTTTTTGSTSQDANTGTDAVGTSATAGNSDTSGSDGKASAGSDPIPTAPATASGEGETVTAPPLAVTDPNGSTPDPTALPAKPSGINPDTPLLGLNGHNPFRPIRLEGTPETSSAGAISQPPAATPDTSNVTITPPRSSAQQINDALARSNTVSGAMPVSPIAGTRNTSGTSISSLRDPNAPASSTAERSSAMQIGAIPVQPIPTTPVTIPAPAHAGSGAQVPANTLNVPSGTGASTTPKPVKPPVVAMNVPSINVDTGVNNAAGPQGGAGQSGTGQGSASQGSTGTAGQTLPQPTTPSLITTTGSTGSGAGTLEGFVQDRQMVFDAAVLGPVNTAVLRTSEGFLVATTGQTLPNSKVSVKEVTATSVTLALGNETTTLQLDKR